MQAFQTLWSLVRWRHQPPRTMPSIARIYTYVNCTAFFRLFFFSFFQKQDFRLPRISWSVFSRSRWTLNRNRNQISHYKDGKERDWKRIRKKRGKKRNRLQRFPVSLWLNFNPNLYVFKYHKHRIWHSRLPSFGVSLATFYMDDNPASPLRVVIVGWSTYLKTPIAYEVQTTDHQRVII